LAKVLLQESLIAEQRKPPMPTECSPSLFDFARVEGRTVVASFDGGRITPDAGALLLGATDRVIGLTRWLAACFSDARDPACVEHEVETLVMQRVVGIALGYEDLLDHDELRHDPVLATLAGGGGQGSTCSAGGKSPEGSLSHGAAIVRRWRARAR
jgi:Transposase DDE domain group 1